MEMIPKLKFLHDLYVYNDSYKLYNTCMFQKKAAMGLFLVISYYLSNPELLLASLWCTLFVKFPFKIFFPTELL